MAWALEGIREGLVSGGFWQWTARVLGVGCVGIWVGLIWGVDHEKNGMFGAFAISVLGFAALIAGAILLAPSLAVWVASPMLQFVESIYLGSHSVDTPPLTYDVAERRILERRWQDAATEFERIAYWHPGEERAWREAVRCAELAGDSQGAARLKRRARLRCPRLRFEP